jgi:hypothetical protein
MFLTVEFEDESMIVQPRMMNRMALNPNSPLWQHGLGGSFYSVGFHIIIMSQPSVHDTHPQVKAVTMSALVAPPSQRVSPTPACSITALLTALVLPTPSTGHSALGSLLSVVVLEKTR